MPTIREIHDAFREGRAEAIGEVEGWIRAVVYGGTWRLPDPEAVQQDTLMELVKIVRRDGVQDPQAFQKFVWTVAKRQCLEHRRRRLRAAESPLEPGGEADEASRWPADPDVDPGVRLERTREWERLLYVYRRLSEDCRTLWAWVYGERRSARQVAERLGVRVGTARVRVHRCLERARAIAAEAAS